MGPLADAEAKLVKVMKFLFCLGSGHGSLGVLGQERGVRKAPNLTCWFCGTRRGGGRDTILLDGKKGQLDFFSQFVEVGFLSEHEG